MNIVKLVKEKLAQTSHHMNITSKLIVSCLLLVFLPLVMFSCYFCLRSIQVSKAEIRTSIESTFEQSYVSINNKLNYIQSSSYYFMTNSGLISLADQTPDTLTLQEQLNIKDSLAPLLPSENFGSEIVDTYVYLSVSFPLFEVSSHFSKISDVRGRTWADYALSNPSYSCFIPSYLYTEEDAESDSILAPSNRLSLIRKVPSPDNFRETSILVRFDFRKSELVEILTNNNTTPDSRTWLIAGDGTPIAESSGDPLPIELSFSSIGPFETVWTETEIGSSAHHVGIRQLENAGWYLVSIVPESDILTHSTTLELQFIMLAALVCLCIVIYIFYLSVSLTGRIKKLAFAMRQYDASGENVLLENNSTDEIGLLVDDYNYLTSRVEHLLATQEANQKALRQSEIRLLRAQMNPHFLYNTLEMLRWYAYNGDKETVENIILQLSTFYKLSLNRGKESYRVSDELNLLQTYFNIMNLRFQNKMQLITEVDEQILSYSVPIIFLQPLLENAIVYGVFGKSRKGGTIRLTGHLSQSDLIFQVQDDGAGMPAQIQDAINHATFQYGDASRGSGFGIKNVIDRIQMLYGPAYGITYSSAPGGGTLATIKIPARY